MVCAQNYAVFSVLALCLMNSASLCAGEGNVMSDPQVIKAAEEAVTKINLRMFGQRGHTGLRMELTRGVQGKQWLELTQIMEAEVQEKAGKDYKLKLRLANPLNDFSTLVAALDKLGSEKTLKLYNQWRSKTKWPSFSTKDQDVLTRRFMMNFIMAVNPELFDMNEPYVGEEDEVHEVLVHEDVNGKMDLRGDKLIEKLPRQERRPENPPAQEPAQQFESDDMQINEEFLQQLQQHQHEQHEQQKQKEANVAPPQDADDDIAKEMEKEAQSSAINDKGGKKSKKSKKGKK